MRPKMHVFCVLLYITQTLVCVTAQQCNAGYNEIGGECVACERGSYRTGTGNVACTKCGPGTYSVTLGATSSTTCLACPQNSGASWFGSYTSACACNPGYTGGNFISRYSTTACVRFVALTPKPSIASVSTRNNAVIGSSMLPTYNALGGPNGNGHVSFNRANSQYLSSVSSALGLTTNGGFAMVIVFRLTGVPVDSEIILNMVSAGGGLQIYRKNIQADLVISWPDLFDDSTDGWPATANTVVQNSWHTLTVCSRASTTELLWQLNSNEFGGQSWTGWTFPDVTASFSLGTSSFQHALNADIAGFFFVDEWMTLEALMAIANEMLNGVDLTNTTCPSGNICTPCPTGTYKTSIGSVACRACSCSALTCHASTGCTCEAGYTGPKGGPCTTCSAGQYKNEPGNMQCQDDPTFTFDCSDFAMGGWYDGMCLDPWMIGEGVCSKCCASCGHVCPGGGSGIITGSCTSCTAGKYSSTQGATTSAVCVDCVAGTYSTTVGATVCTACGAGKYSATEGATGAVTCKYCGPGKYSTTVGATTCLACANNSGSICPICTLPTSCSCNKGYTGPGGGPCTACAAGKYKTIHGSVACISCGSGQYSATAATTCLACHANSTSPVGSSAAASCVCDPGYQPGA